MSGTGFQPRYNLGDWERLNLGAPDGLRYELVDGLLVQCMAGSGAHQLAQTNLVALLQGPARAHGCIAVVESPLAFDDVNARIPDVVVYCDGYDRSPFLQRNPCLIAEVLSPSSVGPDHDAKRKQYLALPSVRAYLIVDPVEHTISVRRAGEKLSYHYGDGDVLDLPCPPMGLEVAAVFA